MKFFMTLWIVVGIAGVVGAALSMGQEYKTLKSLPSPIATYGNFNGRTCLVFQGNALKICSDGTATASPDLKPDDAARQVLDAIKKMWPSIMKECPKPDAGAEPSQVSADEG